MISLDTKRMIYSFYVNDDSFEHPINKLHFKLLERYIHKFDEVIFCIIIDDRERYDLIQRIEEFVISIFHKKLTFKIYDNTDYRESLVFYNEIATQIKNLDGYTFFGHNKGISDVGSYYYIQMWVAAMYYFNLELDIALSANNSNIFYGALKTDGVNKCAEKFYDTIIPKHNWCYCGTFFWGKYQELYKLLEHRREEIPLLTNRWYSELFPGEVTETNYGNCYKGLWILETMVSCDNIDKYLKSTYQKTAIDYCAFVDFFNNVLNELK